MAEKEERTLQRGARIVVLDVPMAEPCSSLTGPPRRLRPPLASALLTEAEGILSGAD